MHICFLNMPIEYYSPVSGGAIAITIMEEAKLLIARGHKVSVLTRIGKDEMYNIGDIIPIQVKEKNELSLARRVVSKFLRILFKWEWPYYEYYLSSFTKALNVLRPKPEVVIVFNDAISSVYIRKIMPEVKIVVYLENELHTNRDLVKKVLPCIDVFLVISGFLADHLLKDHEIDPKRIVVAINGVNLETFRPRQDYLEESPELNVLYIGRIDPNKGPDIVADAVEALQKEGLQVKFTVAGGVKWFGQSKEDVDFFLEKLKAKIDNTGARYLGHVVRKDVPAVIRENDVVCVLSRSNEPLGAVVLEAMASGCAVIASNRGGLPEAAGEAAMLVDPDDLKSVVKALRLLATDHNILNAQKLKSVERAAKAPWSVTVDILERTIAK